MRSRLRLHRFIISCRLPKQIDRYFPAGASPAPPTGGAPLGAAAVAGDALPTATHSFFPLSHSLPFKPKFRSNSTSFQRSSSDSLLFHAFILVFGTPSDIRQNHTESE